MARCYQLSPTQSRDWESGDGWAALRLEEDVMEWAIRGNIKEPIVVITQTNKLAFDLPADRERSWR